MSKREHELKAKIIGFLDCVGINERMIENELNNDPAGFHHSVDVWACSAQRKQYLGNERRQECNKAARELFNIRKNSTVSM